MGRYADGGTAMGQATEHIGVNSQSHAIRYEHRYKQGFERRLGKHSLGHGFSAERWQGCYDAPDDWACAFTAETRMFLGAVDKKHLCIRRESTTAENDIRGCNSYKRILTYVVSDIRQQSMRIVACVAFSCRLYRTYCRTCAAKVNKKRCIRDERK